MHGVLFVSYNIKFTQSHMSMYLLVLRRDSWYLDHRILDRALLRCTVRWYR